MTETHLKLESTNLGAFNSHSIVFHFRQLVSHSQQNLTVDGFVTEPRKKKDFFFTSQ